MSLTHLKLKGKLSFVFVVPQSELYNRALGQIEKDIVKQFANTKLFEQTASKSILKATDEQIDLQFLTNKGSTYKSSTKDTGSIKLNSKSKTKKPKTKVYSMPRVRDAKGRFSSTVKIKEMLQPLVTAAVGANMDSASYFKTDTGRFTKSVRLEDVVQEDRTLFVKYKYMTNPYEAFETGGSYYRAGREPSSIIEGSIRAAAAKVVGKKFKVVPRG